MNTEGVPLLEENEFETEGSGNSVRIKKIPSNMLLFPSMSYYHRFPVTLQVLTANPALNPDEEGNDKCQEKEKKMTNIMYTSTQPPIP